MKKLNAALCKDMIGNLKASQSYRGISLSEEIYLQALEIALPVLEQQENIKHVGYLFVNGEGAVIYSPSGFGISGFTCAGKIYGDVNIHPATDTYRQIENGGWIEWGGGGTCPVDFGAIVDVRFRNGDVDKNMTAGYWHWRASPDLSYERDIIAYRVIEND